MFAMTCTFWNDDSIKERIHRFLDRRRVRKTGYPNYFKGKIPEELKGVIVNNMTLILQNHITTQALDRKRPYEFRPDDIIWNAHLLDRTGAIVNALCAMGMTWDGAYWNRELTRPKK